MRIKQLVRYWDQRHSLLESLVLIFLLIVHFIFQFLTTPKSNIFQLFEHF